MNRSQTSLRGRGRAEGNKLQMKLNSAEFFSVKGGIRATRNRELDITSIFIGRLCRRGLKLQSKRESHRNIILPNPSQKHG